MATSRRGRRWAGPILVGVVLLVAGAAAVAVSSLVRRMKGPPPPECASPPLERKTFGAPTQLSGAQTPGARLYDIEPAAALLPDGTLALAWNARDRAFFGSGIVTARRFTDGGLEAHPLATDRSEAFDAWMARGDDGLLHLVWLAHNGGSPEKDMLVAHVTSADGAAWSKVQPAHAVADCPPGARGCLDKPMVVAADGGVLVFVYSGATGGLRVAAPGAPTSTRVGGGAYGDVVRSASGALHVALVDEAGDAGSPEENESADDVWGSTALEVHYLRSDDSGASWTTSVVSSVGEPIPFFFSNPQVVADEARGLVYVAYPAGARDGRWVIRLATSRDRGRSWSAVTVNDDPPCASHMTPQLALDEATGTVHVTWLENRAGVGGLAYAACEPGGARCGPNEAVSTPFASYSYERNLPAWLSEYGWLEVDAARRTLHAVWTQPVLEDGSPHSRIFHAEARLPQVP